MLSPSFLKKIMMMSSYSWVNQTVNRRVKSIFDAEDHLAERKIAFEAEQRKQQM
jgi:hypothetical protein